MTAKVIYPSGGTPTPAYLLDVVWPTPLGIFDYAAPSAATASGMPRNGGAAVTCYNQIIGGGARMFEHRERFGMELVGGVDGGIIANNLRLMPAITAANFSDARFRHGEGARIFRVECELAIMAGAPGTQSGVAWCSGSRNALGSTYPTAIGNGGGFGLQGNGVGGWQFFSKITVAGGFVQQVPIAWPVPVAEIALVVFEVISAYANVPARLRVYVNGFKFIDQVWTNGLLPTYDLGGGNRAAGFVFGANIIGAGNSIFVGQTRWLIGRFTVEDTEARSAQLGSI